MFEDEARQMKVATITKKGYRSSSRRPLGVGMSLLTAAIHHRPSLHGSRAVRPTWPGVSAGVFKRLIDDERMGDVPERRQRAWTVSSNPLLHLELSTSSTNQSTNSWTFMTAMDVRVLRATMTPGAGRRS
jgi:hypothetical protein